MTKGKVVRLRLTNKRSNNGMFVKDDKPSSDAHETPLRVEVQVRHGLVGEDNEVFIRKAFEQSPEAGYEMLFRRYYRPLCSYVARIVLSREVAEDLVGDVFFNFWQHKPYFKAVTSFRAYLFIAARNLAISYLRSGYGKRVSIDIYDHDPEDKKAVPDQLLQYHELALKIDRLIKEISPQSRKVFMMSRFEGKNNQVIARELDLSTKTVEGHITRVLNLLRKALKEAAFFIIILMISSVSLLGG
jgi:RNA polymerase sigma-70 factor (ECF subfamily)